MSTLQRTTTAAIRARLAAAARYYALAVEAGKGEANAWKGLTKLRDELARRQDAS